jgi:hypothetical protein
MALMQEQLDPSYLEARNTLADIHAAMGDLPMVSEHRSASWNTIVSLMPYFHSQTMLFKDYLPRSRLQL